MVPESEPDLENVHTIKNKEWHQKTDPHKDGKVSTPSTLCPYGTVNGSLGVSRSMGPQVWQDKVRVWGVGDTKVFSSLTRDPWGRWHSQDPGFKGWCTCSLDSSQLLWIASSIKIRFFFREWYWTHVPFMWVPSLTVSFLTRSINDE